jgi:hypothetical protein
MNKLNILPQINFNYWHNKNVEDSNNIGKGVVSMISKITKIYNKDNTFKQAYFCGNNIEINRLKGLNYNEFENEILVLIRVNKSIQDFSDEEILRIFDLIQIWGGLTGGSNPYHIRNNNSTRLGYQSWIKNYRELVIKSIEREVESYEYVLKGNIPYLKMSFGSKHISFWSRRNGDDNCLVIIDNKISGVSGIKIASKANFKLIVENVKKIADELNLMPYQIEKALFTFHKFYFDNSNSKFNNVDINSVDYDKACDLKIVLSIGSNNDLVDSKNYKPRLNTRFIVPKNDYLKINDDVFISVEYIKLNKRKIQQFINELSTSTIDKRVYYKFTGNKEVLEISD